MPLERLKKLKFGYYPYQPGARSPGDRRRFPAVAEKLGLNWELYSPGGDYDAIYVTSNGDLPLFRRQPPGGPKLIFEMVDSYLAVPDWNAKNLVRGLGKWLLRSHSHLELSFRRTVEAICRRADLVVCSTPEQQTRMLELNQNVHPILDFHEELGCVPRISQSETELNLFWEGIGLTASQFSAIGPVLQELSKEFPLRLHLITDLKYRAINLPLPKLDTRRLLERHLGSVKFYLAEWNLTAVRALAGQCHVGLIPLRLDQPLYAAKPENKLLIMWRLGLPTVVSATPAYIRTMKAYGGPYWACDSQDSWYQTLREALSNAEVRQRAAEFGQKYAEHEYGTDALLHRWVQALETLVD